MEEENMGRVVDVDRKEDKKETERKKNKYHQITFWALPEVAEHFGDLLHHYVREALNQPLYQDEKELEKELLSIPRSEMNKFFYNYIIKPVYIYETQYEMLKNLPLGIRRRLYYLINKKLMEVFINESQTHATKYY